MAAPRRRISDEKNDGVRNLCYSSYVARTKSMTVIGGVFEKLKIYRMVDGGQMHTLSAAGANECPTALIPVIDRPPLYLIVLPGDIM